MSSDRQKNGRTDTTVTVCSAEIFSWSIIMNKAEENRLNSLGYNIHEATAINRISDADR
jgi:hypothetical protein